jgi:hypothetical protein
MSNLLILFFSSHYFYTCKTSCEGWVGMFLLDQPSTQNNNDMHNSLYFIFARNDVNILMTNVKDGLRKCMHI